MEGESWPNNMGLKMKCYLGRFKEHSGNKPKTKKSPKPNTKKLRTFSLLIGCMKFLFPKWFITILN
jgi:hypothetical protein